MEKFCIIVLLLRPVLSVPNPQTNLDKLIDDVFNTNNGQGDLTTSPTNPPPVVTPEPPYTPNESDNIDINGGEDSSYNICQANEDCVAYYLCKDNQIVRDGAGVIDIRIDDDTNTGSSSTNNGPAKCGYLDTCCPLGSESSEPIYKPQEHVNEGCGFRNIDGIGFKITGDRDNETEYGEFPWMVAILKEETVSNEILNIYQCGGSLISPSVILTAAHCVANKPASALKVRAGEWDTQTKKELFKDQDRNVVDIVVHENFYKGGLFNDIALLFVASPFDLQENVQPICLPQHGANFDHIRCFATGWGKDTFGQSGQYQVILKKIDLPIVPNQKCQNDLRKTRLGKHFQLHESFICAGGELGKDTCKGDGGSPLVCPIPNTINRYYQAGIVAWGIGCGESYPGVYASVSYLRPWIDAVLARKQYNQENKYFTP